MPSLKEIKGRIASVDSTRKITSAMKMVSSAKLRKAQTHVEQFLPYQKQLMCILDRYLSSDMEELSSSLAEIRDVKRVAIVAVSSNSSFCGAFNSNVIRLLGETIQKYHALHYEIEVYPIGKKIEEVVAKSIIPVEKKGSYISLMDKPNYEEARDIADGLVAGFLSKKIDKVELIYNRFKSMGIQIPTNEPFLPVVLSKNENQTATLTDYIVEPDGKTLLDSLLPKSLRAKIFAVILDSAAAEQAARTVAMQIATDNANDLMDELTLQYNKQRQQAITSELLDIIGGSEALK
ncbi:MAG: F0F1 ATP synthase subunit gamma [Dysgonamonadaceae bacterium]|jgi:F-type H+-transporting ATPase subunit gamma|nr:F0F1 ATP synthase subunit gamma [Dysgonamonadaceae bacterium]